MFTVQQRKLGIDIYLCLLEESFPNIEKANNGQAAFNNAVLKRGQPDLALFAPWLAQAVVGFPEGPSGTFIQIHGSRNISWASHRG